MNPKDKSISTENEHTIFMQNIHWVHRSVCWR